jgi:hypothetical protein
VEFRKDLAGVKDHPSCKFPSRRPTVTAEKDGAQEALFSLGTPNCFTPSDDRKQV